MLQALFRFLLKLFVAMAMTFLGLPYLHSHREAIWKACVYGMKALKDALRFTLSKAFEFTLWALAKSLACLRLCCNLIYTYAKKACANVPHYVVLTTGQVLVLSIVAVTVVSGVAWCIASIHYSLEIDVLEEAVRNPENPRTHTPKTRRSKVIFEENALGQLCIAFDDSQDEKDTKEDPIQEEEEPTAKPRASDAWSPPAVKTCSDRSNDRLLQIGRAHV